MKIQYMSDLHLEFSDNSRWLKHNELPASGKFREIPSDFELLEIPHFAPVLIEKTKQNKTTISDNPRRNGRHVKAHTAGTTTVRQSFHSPRHSANINFSLYANG